MDEISYKVTMPDPYQTAYDCVIAEFNRRLQRREEEGIEAALKEHGYVKERTGKNIGEPKGSFLCSECGWGDFAPAGFPLKDAKYCPCCGVRMVE